ncbi:aldolase [Sinomonas humi]|uniref:Aldolase n=1 Tax=Sinomonas humi TaxID=1338436 RepID=A0A0B2ANS7_9MICC|nr:aldolase [Sinomonas humi]
MLAGRSLTANGLSRGSAGNLSVREGDHLLMSPTGSDLGSLVAASLSVLDFEGNLLEGPRPSKEFPFHRAFYRRDRSTNAVVHVHSPAAMAVSCLEPWTEWSAIPPLTPYFVMRVGQTPLVPYADPGDPSQADWIEAIPFPLHAVLLQNHGAITVGRDLAEAVDTAVELEQVCDTLLRTAGLPKRLLSQETAVRLAGKYGRHWTLGQPAAVPPAHS